MRQILLLAASFLMACSASVSDDCALVTNDDVGQLMCGCGSFGGPGTTPVATCSESSMGRAALCISRPSSNICDCRAYVCRTRASDGRCSCSVGAYEGPGDPDYTTSDSCSTTTGVCCLEAVDCTCGLAECRSEATQVASCDAGEVLDDIAPLYLSGGGTQVASCSE